MNIQEAINRVSYLKDNLKRVRYAREKCISNYAGDAEINARSRNGDRAFTVVLHHSNLSEILDLSEAESKKEIDKLEPIIEMANAALKGVLSDD